MWPPFRKTNLGILAYVRCIGMASSQKTSAEEINDACDQSMQPTSNLAREDARKRFGGYRSHLTKLMREIDCVLSNESPGNPTALRELIVLKKKADSALAVYVAAVKESGAVGDDLEASNLKQKSQLMSEIGARFTAFVAAAAERGSIYGSSTSSKRRSKSGSTKLSAAKSSREAAEAEINFVQTQRIAALKRDALLKKQEAEMRQRQAEQEVEKLRLETETGLEMIQAEAAVQRARAAVAAEEDTSPMPSVTEEVAPPMSTMEKVSKFIDSISCDDRVSNGRLAVSGAGVARFAGGMVDDQVEFTHSHREATPVASGMRDDDCILVDPSGCDRREIFVKSGVSGSASGLKLDAVAEPSTLNRRKGVGHLGYSSRPDDGIGRALPGGIPLPRPISAINYSSGQVNRPHSTLGASGLDNANMPDGTRQSCGILTGDTGNSVDSLAEAFARAGLGVVPKLAIKFNGASGDYYRFKAQVQTHLEDSHLALNPSRALQFLLDSTEGDALDLIKNCTMTLNKTVALRQALELLERAFGSKDVEFRELLRQICDGPLIKNEHKALLKFYIGLQGCKVAAENSDALEELNANSTIDALFQRLPWDLRKDLHSRAVRNNLKDRVPFDFIVDFVLERAEAANSRWGRLLSMPNQARSQPKSRSVRLNAFQTSNVEPATKNDAKGGVNVASLPRSKSCLCCDSESHLLHQCDAFKKKDLPRRRAFVREKQLCFNCLGTNHQARQCPSKGRCSHCQEAHHSLLHLHKAPTKPASPAEVPQTISESSITASLHCDKTLSANTDQRPGKVRKLLQVLPVSVSDQDRTRSRQTLCLLDVGSDTHVITRNFAKKIGLEGEPIVSRTQYADGSSSGEKMTERVSCQVRGLNEANSYLLDDVLVVDTIADLKSRSPQASDIDESEHLWGVEIPFIEDSAEVELIIGGIDPRFHKQYEVREGGLSSLWAVKTILGWTLLGRSCNADSQSHAELDDEIHIQLLVTDELETAMKSICSCGPEWADLHSDPDALLPSLDDERATEIMKRTCKLVDGHQQIGLPFKLGCPKLPKSNDMAKSRLWSLKRRFNRNPEAHSLYRAKIDEMINLGHAKEVKDTTPLKEEERFWYIPHHYVANPKFRMVFDCAASVGGVSLNNQILQGPDNTNSLLGVLFRFRFHKVALAGDIRNMFHQVKVSPVDQSVLRFYWWKNGDLNSPILTYQLTVHCFGLTSSPSVSGFALRRTAEENRSNASAQTISAVYRNFYVDDLLVSAPSTSECVKLAREMCFLLRSGGFEMAKFSSNDSKVLQGLPKECLTAALQEVDIESDALPSHKVLGLAWDPNRDSFLLKVCLPNSIKWTRRSLLSILMSVYDPLGMAAPFLLPAKVMMQQLTQQTVDWDADVGEEHRSLWKKFLDALPCLNELAMPRLYGGLTYAARTELHVFADASKLGFGAVCYMRTFDEAGYAVTFVIGKSRVAPTPRQSIPRLELCGAVAAVKLLKLVKREHNLNVDKTVFWTDSTTVLSYIHSTSKRRPVFETNRIKLIRNLSDPEQWRWVDTARNPADSFSRGVHPSRVQRSDQWLLGPAFLLEEEMAWPKQPAAGSAEPCLESGHLNAATNEVIDNARAGRETWEHDNPLKRLTTRYSSLHRTVKAAAWLLRVKSWLREKSRARARNCLSLVLPVSREDIDGKEYEIAFMEILRLAQEEAYPGLVEALKTYPAHEVFSRKRVMLPHCSPPPIAHYCPFVADGVVRIGGRLQRADAPVDFRHPIVLPRRHHLTGLVIEDAHRRSGHFGVQYVGNLLRERFHVVGGGRTVKHYIRTLCMSCRNRRVRPGQQQMAPLPLERVTPKRQVFHSVGLDFMGPILVRVGKRTSSKRYICVFTCLATRATHLEVAFDLSTSSFISALRRFLAVRGNATRVIFSDNATNFVGAEAELMRGLRELDRRKIIDDLATRGIVWRHSPPLASHQGGVFESIIRLVRKTMTGLMEDRYWRTLSDEQLLTLAKEIEHILNCRPLTRSSFDPNDLSAISPMTILSGCLDPVSSPDVFHDSDCLRSNWRASQMWAEKYWKRWKAEYLPTLQRRQKWLTPHTNFAVNDLVLMVGEDSPRNDWPKAIITEVMPHADGKVRRVKIRAANGKTYVRDVRKLCRLEGDL